MKDIFEELTSQILMAESHAIENHIMTNAVCLNEDFDYVKELKPIIVGMTSKYMKPMILGKHIFIGRLPKDYSFALMHVDESEFDTELDYYKRKCEMLENKLNQVKEALGLEGEEE